MSVELYYCCMHAVQCSSSVAVRGQDTYNRTIIDLGRAVDFAC